MSTSSSMRDKILEAAIRKASRDGLLTMTLDNVAKEAGVSKGGLIHHYPTKDDLVRSLLQYFGEQCERALLEKLASDNEPRFRWARGMLSLIYGDGEAAADHQSSSEPATFTPETMDRFMLAALAMAVNNPGSFEPLRQIGRKMRQRFLSDAETGMEQLLIWLAVDGLFLWQFLGMIEKDDPQFRNISNALRAKVGLAPLPPEPSGEPQPNEPSIPAEATL